MSIRGLGIEYLRPRSGDFETLVLDDARVDLGKHAGDVHSASSEHAAWNQACRGDENVVASLVEQVGFNPEIAEQTYVESDIVFVGLLPFELGVSYL